LQARLGPVAPQWVPGRLIEPKEATRKESHGFARIFLLNTQQGTQIKRKPQDSLLQHLKEAPVLESEWPHKSRAEPIEGIISTVRILLQPPEEAESGIGDLGSGLTFIASRVELLNNRFCHRFRPCCFASNARDIL
jgi:hypothetical protein